MAVSGRPCRLLRASRASGGWPAVQKLDESLAGSATYGSKASGLARLLARGFPVPDAFVVDPREPLDETHVWEAVQTWTTNALDHSGRAWLAVRSSSPDEDSLTASHAGEFRSIIGLRPFEPSDLTQAIKEAQESGKKAVLPVIVQVAVDPMLSGVAFSCDPISLERAPYVISWVKGMGVGLASGQDEGSLLVIRSITEDAWAWPHEKETLQALVTGLDEMEADYDGPVDIEWAIDSEGKLWILQARPVVLPQVPHVDGRKVEDLALLPGVVAGHPKMRLRAAAARMQVMMSNAVVLTTTKDAPATSLDDWHPSDGTAGLSIVLIHPSVARRKVQREFAQVDDMDVPFFTLGCRRYAIRRYPSRSAAATVATDILTRGLQESWIASVVVQEIHDAEATGIVRKLGDEFLVELAVGHFVPKGVVDPTRIVISASGKVVESHRVHQDIAYRFINGYVVTEHPVERQLQLSDDEVALAIRQIAPLFQEYSDAALEFGIIRNRDDSLSGYVIDMAEGDSASCAMRLDRNLIRAGVVSPGHAIGHVMRVSNGTAAELDTHFLEGFGAPEKKLEDVVIVADRASVDLLPLVNRCGSNTAFVFRHASVLAHLCVVLRERGVPAIALEDSDLFDGLDVGSKVTVEASNGSWGGRRVLRETESEAWGSGWF
jgi:phosphohistidine swiveling domain-containing protein